MFTPRDFGWMEMMTVSMASPAAVLTEAVITARWLRGHDRSGTVSTAAQAERLRPRQAPDQPTSLSVSTAATRCRPRFIRNAAAPVNAAASVKITHFYRPKRKVSARALGIPRDASGGNKGSV